MLQVNWKLVEKIAEELYPSYAKGMLYSELQSKLTQQGFDQNHINAIAEALEKRYRQEHANTVNIPLVLFSFTVAIIFVIGIALVFETGYILLAVGICILIFILAKMLLRNARERSSHRARWK